MKIADDPGLTFVAAWFEAQYGLPLPEPDDYADELLNQAPMLPAEEQPTESEQDEY